MTLGPGVSLGSRRRQYIWNGCAAGGVAVLPRTLAGYDQPVGRGVVLHHRRLCPVGTGHSDGTDQGGHGSGQEAGTPDWAIPGDVSGGVSLEVGPGPRGIGLTPDQPIASR